MVIPNFVRQALTGAPITVYSDGRQKRGFCLDDILCRVIEHAGRELLAEAI